MHKCTFINKRTVKQRNLIAIICARFHTGEKTKSVYYTAINNTEFLFRLLTGTNALDDIL